MPRVTAGALAVCCHLLSSLGCTDASSCLQVGLLAKPQVMVGHVRWPTWHHGWKVGQLTRQCLHTGRGLLVERWGCQRREPFFWRNAVLQRSSLAAGAGQKGHPARGNGSGAARRWTTATGMPPASSLLQPCPGPARRYGGMLLRRQLCGGTAELIWRVKSGALPIIPKAPLKLCSS